MVWITTFFHCFFTIHAEYHIKRILWEITRMGGVALGFFREALFLRSTFFYVLKPRFCAQKDKSFIAVFQNDDLAVLGIIIGNYCLCKPC